MCGRYTVTRPGELVEEALDALESADESQAAEGRAPERRAPERQSAEVAELLARPRYNAAPSEVLPVLFPRVAADGGVSAYPVGAAWGFPVPGGKRGPQINARSETAATLPTFADSFERRRCLVPADGFYEWRHRQPYRFVLEGGGGFCFAGLWTEAAGRPAFCILTTNANRRVAEVHDRMPVILVGGVSLGRWLDERSTRDDLEALCRPLEAERIGVYTVGSRVNRAGIDEPSLIEEVAPPPENLSLF